jgi:1,4-alpha-glucan branching enzyme
MLKNLSITLFLTVAVLFTLNAQITVDPPFPTADEPVKVILNTEGTALENYEGVIYAHTGLTIGGAQWQNVVGDWGNNDNQPALTHLEGNLYELHIVPSIRFFYDADANDNITEMSFVFRSADGSQQTSPDIFYNVYEEVLAVLITEPENTPVIVQLNDTIHVKWGANLADSSFLYIDDQQVFAGTGSSFSYDIVVTEGGKKWVTAVAKNETDSVSDSFYYYVRGDVVEEEKPDGVRDGINYINDSTVILCLYAPDKEYVFAWGDWSSWEFSDDIFMKRTPDKDRYWIEITNLEPKRQYIFQYYIDGEIRIGDPYCEQVSDPWNDHYISNATYPDLPEYPHDKTEFIASVLQTAQDKYQWKNTDFKAPKKTDLVIYELLVRDFTARHDYTTLTDTLDYLERLGVNAIELMPVNEFEGNLSWGYNPNYYFAPDKYYGHRNTLKAFIDECHGRGIAVIIDIVLNHSYLTSPLNLMYYDWENGRPLPNSPWYNEYHNFLNPDAHWGDDFNHESLQTQALVDSVNSYWMSEYKFDGFRFDFTKGFSNTIHGNDDPWGSKYDADRIRLLKRMADEIWKRNEDAFVIFEHLSDNAEEKELANYGILMWGNLNHAYNEGTMGWNENGKSDFSWISYQKRQWNDPHVVGYMESHDEERLMFKNITYGNSSPVYNTKDTTTALQRMALAANFLFTVPGPKMIWQFGERGYDYSIDFNGRTGEKPPRWDYMEEWRRRTLYYTYQALINLKIDEDAFESRVYDMAVRPAMKRIRVTSDDMSVVVLGNFDVIEDEINPNFYHTGTWYDYWTGEEIEVTDVNDPITLMAGEFRLYTDKKLQTPDFVGVDENIAPGAVSDFITYPNPASSQVNLEMHLSNSSTVSVKLYDIQGRMIKDIFKGQHPSGLRKIQADIAGVHPGLYFVVVQSEGQRLTKKIMIN